MCVSAESICGQFLKAEQCAGEPKPEGVNSSVHFFIFIFLYFFGPSLLRSLGKIVIFFPLFFGKKC